MKLKYLSCSHATWRTVFDTPARKPIREDGIESKVSHREKDGNAHGK